MAVVYNLSRYDCLRELLKHLTTTFQTGDSEYILLRKLLTHFTAGEPEASPYRFQQGDYQQCILRKILQWHTTAADAQYQFQRGDEPQRIVRKWLQYLTRDEPSDSAFRFQGGDSEILCWRKLLGFYQLDS
jgi:hypothetical protein